MRKAEGERNKPLNNGFSIDVSRPISRNEPIDVDERFVLSLDKSKRLKKQIPQTFFPIIGKRDSFSTIKKKTTKTDVKEIDKNIKESTKNFSPLLARSVREATRKMMRQILASDYLYRLQSPRKYMIKIMFDYFSIWTFFKP